MKRKYEEYFRFTICFIFFYGILVRIYRKSYGFILRYLVVWNIWKGD